jgi:hypothetical protein
MLKQKFVTGIAFAILFVIGAQVNSFAFAKKVRAQATFTVKIENISNPDGLVAQDGSKYPFAISPGLYLVTDKKMDLFREGRKAGDALQSQAEEGNPELLAKEFLTKVGSINEGVFSKPVGSDMASPLLPGHSFEFSFKAEEGEKLNLSTMFGQSNDLFYAPKDAINLFVEGKAISGDITDQFLLWDAGTEVNQAPGIGPDQAPRQKAPHTGARENSVVQLVKDGFVYPNTKDVLRITVTAQ